jgi:hypothetical protein
LYLSDGENWKQLETGNWTLSGGVWQRSAAAGTCRTKVLRLGFPG